MKTELDCREVLSLLKSDYLDDELDPAGRGQVDRHLESCPACRKVRENLELITRPLRQTQKTAVPESVWQHLQSRISRRSLARFEPAGISLADILKPFSMRPAFAAAAAAAVLIVISMAFYLATQPAVINEIAPDLTSLLGNGEIREPNTSFGSYIEQYLL